MIDANIFPVLMDILWQADFRTRKEAAWAVTNATTGGTADQIKYLVQQVSQRWLLGYLKPRTRSALITLTLRHNRRAAHPTAILTDRTSEARSRSIVQVQVQVN